MLKKTISYTDFDGVDQEEVYYFNISKPELIEWEVENKEGLQVTIEKIVEEKDRQKLLALFKRIILSTIGVREGSRFIKTEQVREEFEQSLAYESLFMELLTSDRLAAEFFKGILPADIGSSINVDELISNTSTTPATTSTPVPPVPPTN